jgi:dethiobiotin synthetase
VVRALVQQGLRVAAMKPVAAGAASTPEGLRNADALALAAAANVAAPYEVINPFCFPQPVSPHIGAHDSGITIDIQLIKTRCNELARNADVVVVEGAGGWLAPISAKQTMADIAITLGLPVLLVVGLRLGCLNHALLTAQAIEASGLRLTAWVGNHVEFHFERSAENIAMLEARLRRPPLDILRFEPLSPDAIGLSASAATALLTFCLD